MIQPAHASAGTPVLDVAQVPVFSDAERERRWTLARRLMADQDLRGLIVYGAREGSFPAPFALDTYFTNDRPGAVVIVPRDGDPKALVALPMAVAGHIQATTRREPLWIKPENIFAAKKGEGVVRVLQKSGLTKGRIGVIGLEPYPPYYFDGAMPYNTWKTVLDQCPEAEFIPVQRPFLAMTAARSEEEIEVLRWSARIGEAMCEAMLAATHPGVSEADVYAAALEVCPRHAGFTGLLLMGSGHEYFAWGPPSWVYRPRPPRVIRDGDVVLSEVFCSVGMLETQHQPTIAVGTVHVDFVKAAEASRKSYEAGLRALRPGARFGEVVQAMEEPIRTAGGTHVHPWIHSMNPFGLISGLTGLSDLPGADRYGFVGEIPLVGGEAVLAPGMTFAFEPNCALGRHVVNLGGTVVVGEEGPLELNQLATRLMRV